MCDPTRMGIPIIRQQLTRSLHTADDRPMELDTAGQGHPQAGDACRAMEATRDPKDVLGTDGGSRSAKARNTGRKRLTRSHSDEIPSLTFVSSMDSALISVPFISAQIQLQSMKPILEKDLLLTTSYLTKRIVNLEDANEVRDKLNRAMERLSNLENSIRTIESDLQTELVAIRARISSLEENRVPTMEDTTGFNFRDYRKRISWVVAEYLSRKGYLAAANQLSIQEGLHGCVSIAFNEQCIKIYRELEEHKIDAALAWAEQHREAIRSVGSRFWEEMKVQEVVMHLQRNEIGKAMLLLKSFKKDTFDRCPDARKLYAALVFLNVDIARISDKDHGDRTGDNLAPTNLCNGLTGEPSSLGARPTDDKHSSQELPNMRCIYCTERPNDSCAICSRYSKLIDDERWDYLSAEFERCGSLVYHLGRQPILENLIQEGFCAIKSDSCRDHRTPTCPACLPEWRSYVDQIPSSQKLNSVLLCPVTGTVMGDDNPPFTAPDGYVLSENGILTMTRAQKGHHAQGTRNKELIDGDGFRKIFIT